MPETTITVRLPDDLKDLVELACSSRGMTLTAFVREALMDKLAPSTRSFQLPAFTDAFASILAEFSASR